MPNIGLAYGARNARFGEGNGLILLDNVDCNGTEASLFNCRANDAGSHNCRPSEDAGVYCPCKWVGYVETRERERERKRECEFFSFSNNLSLLETCVRILTISRLP